MKSNSISNKKEKPSDLINSIWTSVNIFISLIIIIFIMIVTESHIMSFNQEAEQLCNHLNYSENVWYSDRVFKSTTDWNMKNKLTLEKINCTSMKQYFYYKNQTFGNRRLAEWI